MTIIKTSSVGRLGVGLIHASLLIKILLNKPIFSPTYFLKINCKKNY